MKNTAVVCMAYGLSSDGQNLSPQAEAIVKEAKKKRYQVGADIILQGGFHIGEGLTEAEQMERCFQGDFKVFKETTSMNTIEGAINIKKIVLEQGYEFLYVVAQSFHSWRVRYTFSKVFADTDVKITVISVTGGRFGGNSQSRLNSGLR